LLKEATVTEEIKTIEVHNVWTVQELHRIEPGKNGKLAKAKEPESMAFLHRPQDWGDPKWHYIECDFTWSTGGTRYVNHFHGWTDIPRENGHAYLELFAPLIVQILLPGCQPELCGKEYLDEEDFWNTNWGPRPPFFAREDPDWEEFVDDLPEED
jgi:hypothetical protein